MQLPGPGDAKSGSKLDCKFDRTDADRQTDGNGHLFFRSLGVMERRENIKVASRPMDSIK